ncbi:MAG: phosphoribosylformylglycinamidine synthase subunit PurL [Cohaesibacteraceae bacterium]|nr:phosphoribosylformylglycinamidine synthase subunit PurL [Cohaesibacteraceae bacterium]
MTDFEITPQLIADHGITDEEYARILELTGREPTYTELGIWSAMWNEHCSYKSSKKWLKTLPTTGKRVVHGPGENAGVVDIDDGETIIFKMESHNHPSYIEPYQGATTGVGGILRDVFTMGARPIAVMNALRFGDPDHPKTRHVASGVVAGVGGYGNSFGVPTVGGEVEFHPSYNGNCLVNAFAAGLADIDKIFLSEAKGVGMPIVYLGAKTGRDGVGGATMASAEFDDSIEEKRPTVQVGDPFTEKRLLEATLELMKTGAVNAIQDMGAAGLTCSAVEMGAKGNLGVHLDLDLVPVREDNMTAYEMMLSESQERMLMVLNPAKQAEAEAVFKKWELDFAVVGHTTDTLRFEVFHKGEKVADLPIKDLGDEAPEYDRPWLETPASIRIKPADIPVLQNPVEALAELMGSPNQCSRRWVYEQYDTLIQGNTKQGPGGDAGVIRVLDETGRRKHLPTQKGLAFSVDVTPRYCKADPFEGGKQAVAECWRNISATGALPLAATDNLNFGNPERPEIMGQFVGCIKGIGAACKALEFPIVSGNVSLYNETNGEAILPTPAIGGVGLLTDVSLAMTIPFKNRNDVVLLVGGHGNEMGQSVYLQHFFDREEGSPPPVDLAKEKSNGDYIRSIILNRQINACHDISQGGLGLALADMCVSSGKGCVVDLGDEDAHIALFAEDQARYIVTCHPDQVQSVTDMATTAGVNVIPLGTVAGDTLKVTGVGTISVAQLKNAHEEWFPSYMAG